MASIVDTQVIDQGGMDSIYVRQEDVPGFSDVPVLLHVGLHKTGTTWLQQQIFRPKDGNDIVCCNDSTYTHCAFMIPDYGAFSVRGALQKLDGYIGRARTTGLPLVVSDEALAGFSFHHKYSRETQAVRLKRTFPRGKVLITVREQGSLLLSMYGEYLKYGYSSTLSDFLADAPQDSVLHPIVDRNFYDYDRLLTLYGAIFGDENVLALPMEWMTRDPDGAVARIAEFLGAPLLPPDPELTRTAKNQAWNGLARETARLMNHFVSQDSRWNQKPGYIAAKLHPMSIATRVDRWGQALGIKPSLAKDKAIVRETLGDYYAASNGTFRRRTGFDLAAFGYACAP